MSVEFQNKIDEHQRFAKQDGNEYSVFSVHVTNPSDVSEWVRIVKPDRVLMDHETFETFQNKHIEWVFDDKNVLNACKIHQDSGISKTSD